MAISDNTRSNDGRKVEEYVQVLQSSSTEFQKEVESQMLMQQEQQETSINNLRRLITRLSHQVVHQVVQLANNSAGSNGGKEFSNTNFIRFSGVEFHQILIEVMCKDRFILHRVEQFC